MITFIASHPHLYTFKALRGEILSPLMPDTRAITYDALFAASSLKPGTYVFTDMERLHPAELRLAGQFYRRLRELPGFRALNDPARVRTRYGLLRALAEAGLNDFDAYYGDGFPQPRSFPVFLRIASTHAGPIGDLIEDQAELDMRLRELAERGIPLCGVLVVEFCGGPGPHGYFEKFAFLKIGERITLSALLINESWNVKIANSGMHLVTPEIMSDQLEAIRTERNAEKMREAFDIAGIDYGRADVGISNGRLQVYEINTNPNISASNSFASAEHRESRLIFRERYGAMMHAIDCPPEGDRVALALNDLDKPSRDRRDMARTAAANARAAKRLATMEAAAKEAAREAKRLAAEQEAAREAERLAAEQAPRPGVLQRLRRRLA